MEKEKESSSEGEDNMLVAFEQLHVNKDSTRFAGYGYLKFDQRYLDHYNQISYLLPN